MACYAEYAFDLVYYDAYYQQGCKFLSFEAF